jgi:parallel beta-helix repeat protein
LWNSSDNCITNCNAYNNAGGFYLISYSNNNHITNCNVYNNSEGGIFLIGSSNNNITNCNIYNNYNGIFTDNSSNNYITKCNIYDNPQYGISLYYFSNNNTIHHNNFFNNTQNANDGCTNTWYNTTLKEGNYWDDYNGADTNGDGIGDTPYNITGGDNQDRYPLVKRVENVSEIQSYIACGCGCCDDIEPLVVCLYHSKGDDIQKIIKEDQEAAQNPDCALVGCSRGIKYVYCD